LGGQDINSALALGSYQGYRFRAPSLLLLQEDFEHSIWGPFGLKFMADQGRVALTRGDLGIEPFLTQRHVRSISMTARIWHGATPASKSDEYLNLMRTVAIPDYRSSPGNRGAYALRRIEGDTAHFLMVTFWESEVAIRAFAGVDISAAKYYDFDKDFLLELEPCSVHYEMYER